MNRLTCPHCNGTHRTMEICPQAPGWWALIQGWFNGDRTPMHHIAVAGTTAILAVLALAILAAAHG